MALSYILASAVPELVTVAKARFFIGTQAADPAGDTYTEVGAVMNIPTYGPSESDIKVQTIGNDLEVTLKGVTTLGGGDLQVAMDESDAGQDAMIAAQGVKTGNYNFRIVWPNGPSGPDVLTSVSHGTIKDIKGLVMGRQEVMGGPNNAIQRTFKLGFNSIPVTTPKA